MKACETIGIFCGVMCIKVHEIHKTAKALSVIVNRPAVTQSYTYTVSFMMIYKSIPLSKEFCHCSVSPTLDNITITK